MASQPFPEGLFPTKRTLRFGDYPVKTYRSLSGAITKRIFGSKAIGYELDLEFENINEERALIIWNHYHLVRGTGQGFVLNFDVMRGYSANEYPAVLNEDGSPRTGFATITDEIQESLIWYYAGPPEMESVFRDLSTVRVSFIAELPS
jgi:hypothetical protein